MSDVYVGVRKSSRLFSGKDEIYQVEDKLYFRGHIVDELYQGTSKIWPIDKNIVHVGEYRL